MQARAQPSLCGDGVAVFSGVAAQLPQSRTIIAASQFNWWTVLDCVLKQLPRGKQVRGHLAIGGRIAWGEHVLQVSTPKPHTPNPESEMLMPYRGASLIRNTLTHRITIGP